MSIEEASLIVEKMNAVFFGENIRMDTSIDDMLLANRIIKEHGGSGFNGNMEDALVCAFYAAMNAHPSNTSRCIVNGNALFITDAKNCLPTNQVIPTVEITKP